MSLSTTTLFLCFLLLINSSTYAQGFVAPGLTSQDTAGFTLVETNYGLVKTGEEIKIEMQNSPTGSHILTNEFEFFETVDTIQAKLNMNFGAEFILKSKVDRVVPLTVVWKFPSKMFNRENQEFNDMILTTPQYTNMRFYNSYKFEESYEIKPGMWQLLIYHEGKLLYKREFFVQLII